MLTNKDFQSFIEYWRKLADADGGVPHRSAFQLKDFPHIAPYFFLLDWYGLYDIKVRFLGTALDDFLPTLAVGGDFLVLYEPDQQPFYAACLAHVCTHPCGIDMLCRITLQNGERLVLRGIGLPVRAENGTVSFIAGLVETPRPDTPLGFSGALKRAGSEILSLDYLDVGHGVPAEKPAFPLQGAVVDS